MNHVYLSVLFGYEVITEVTTDNRFVILIVFLKKQGLMTNFVLSFIGFGL